MTLSVTTTPKKVEPTANQGLVIFQLLTGAAADVDISQRESIQVDGALQSNSTKGFTLEVGKSVMLPFLSPFWVKASVTTELQIETLHTR